MVTGSCRKRKSKKLRHQVLILHESISPILNLTEGGFLEVILVLAAASHTIVRVVAFSRSGIVLWLILMPERY